MREGGESLGDAPSTAIATEKRGCVKKGDGEVHEMACAHPGGCSHRRAAWDRSGLAERSERSSAAGNTKGNPLFS